MLSLAVSKEMETPLILNSPAPPPVIAVARLALAKETPVRTVPSELVLSIVPVPLFRSRAAWRKLLVSVALPRMISPDPEVRVIRSSTEL
jgi:hypothetical protein